jgi:hypothetical protein
MSKHKQRPTKTITGAYTTTDADCGYTLICISETPFDITLHTPTGRYNFDMNIYNDGAGTVTCGGQSIAQNCHAHVGNNGGTAWVVVIGGGSLELGETDTTAYRGDRGKTAYDHSQGTHANPLAIVPAGGALGQVLKKNSVTDYDLKWDDPSAATNGIPSGGTTGQVLAKVDDTNYNTQWVTPSSGGGATVDSDWGQL